MMKATHPVWDLSTRVFHWLLLLSVLAAWVSIELDETQLHFYAGYSVLLLLLFRLMWGIVGSSHSRFSDFVAGPAAVFQYLRTNHSPTPGHNPLGALSVVLMLMLLLAQVFTGLLNQNDSGDYGPYAAWVSDAWVDVLSSWHEQLFLAIQIAVVLHVLAIVYYGIVKNDRLMGAMISGYKKGQSGAAAPVSHWRAVLIWLLAVGAVVTLLAMAPEMLIEEESYY